jgi:hypothetical protein
MDVSGRFGAVHEQPVRDLRSTLVILDRRRPVGMSGMQDKLFEIVLTSTNS